MNTSLNWRRAIAWLGVAFLQLILTQGVTLLASLPFPNGGDYLLTHTLLLAGLLGITFSAGVFLGGWLGIQFHWLDIKPMVLARLASTLVGSYLPLFMGILLTKRLEPGSPFFAVSILCSIAGFYLPGWRGLFTHVKSYR